MTRCSLILKEGDITLTTEFISTKTMSEWQHEEIDLHKKPTIYIIQRDY